MNVLLSILLVCAATQLLAQDRAVVVPARIFDDSTDAAVTATKVEAGLALALDLTTHYDYIPSFVRDSLVTAVTGEPVTTLQAADIVKADIAVFVKCIRVANLVRAEVSLRSGDSLANDQHGVGYASISHRSDSGVIADPAILASVQRALCNALQDSALYANAPEDLRVIPTRLLSIGGIDFRNDSSVTPPWSLFQDRTVVGYDVAINVVHELQANPAVTVVDLDTRDSMFAMGGLLMVENDRPVSNTELRILSLFDVREVITGSLVRDKQGALLQLHWCSIEPDGRYRIERTAEQRVEEDSAVVLRERVLACLRELLP